MNAPLDIVRAFFRVRPAAAAMVVALGFPLMLPQSAPAHDERGNFADLAEQLSPAVVNISTAQNLERSDRGQGSPLEELFRDLYPQGRPDGPRQVTSLGSGFVISSDGYIVTNNHVIEDADEISVNFPDGLSLAATVVGTDSQTDIAVLKVAHDAPLPAVQFGDSDRARVGDWVLAIANPFGFAGSVSAGSSTARMSRRCGICRVSLPTPKWAPTFASSSSERARRRRSRSRSPCSRRIESPRRAARFPTRRRRRPRRPCSAPSV